MTEVTTEPTFLIGNVPIYGDAILSPMVGYSDAPFRGICREMGSAMSIVPCVLDEAVIYGAPRGTFEAGFRETERPVAIQMLSKDPERLRRACDMLMPSRPDMFDINLGCPARRVVFGGRGVALMRDPLAIARLVGPLVRALSVPVTAKIRLGWDDSSRNYVEVARVLEGGGVAAISVHGRTKVQGYGGTADWEAIAEVRASVKVPVLANGDVWRSADIEALKRATDCPAVLIGRGAIGNPWIFGRREIEDVTIDERVEMVRRHLGDMVSLYGPVDGVIRFRKHAIKYVRGLPDATLLRPKLVACDTTAQVIAVLEACLHR